MRAKIKKLREEFSTFLESKQFTVLPGSINAVLLKFDSEEETTAFVKYLKKNHITVSQGNGGSNIGLDNSFVRIAIGTQTQMDEVTKIISKYKK